MTAKGLIVTEVEEDIAGLPAASISGHSQSPSVVSNGSKGDDTASKSRSPIAELLYMRWLDGLKIKWPSIMGMSSTPGPTS